MTADPPTELPPTAGPPRTTTRQWLGGLLAAVLLSVAVVGLIVWFAMTFVMQGCGASVPCETADRTAPPTSPGPSRTDWPLQEAVTPGGILCGRHDAARCAAAIQLVRDAHPDDVARAWAIVVDDVCDPRVICDRLYPFATAVVLVPRPDAAGTPVSFLVVGLGDWPERIEGNAGPLPPHIVAMIESLS